MFHSESIIFLGGNFETIPSLHGGKYQVRVHRTHGIFYFGCIAPGSAKVSFTHTHTSKKSCFPAQVADSRRVQSCASQEEVEGLLRKTVLGAPALLHELHGHS